VVTNDAALPRGAGDQPSSLELIRDLLVPRGIVPDSVTPDATLESLGIDSLAVVEMLFQVEMRLHITLPDSRAPVATVGEFASLLDELRAAAAVKTATS
jgi:acyl carrier protein